LPGYACFIIALISTYLFDCHSGSVLSAPDVTKLLVWPWFGLFYVFYNVFYNLCQH